MSHHNAVAASSERTPIVARVLGRLGSWVTWVRAWLSLLLLVRFSLLLAIVCALVLFLNDQTQDIIVSLSEESRRWSLYLVPLTALICAWIAWYSARILYYFEYPNLPATTAGRFMLTKRFLPRLLGATCLALTGAAVMRAVGTIESADVASPLRVLSWVMFGLALGFLFLPRVWEHFYRPVPPSSIGDWRRVPRHAYLVVATAVIGFVGFWLFDAARLDLAVGLGTIAIVYLAAAGLIATGSLLIWIGSWSRVPLVELAIVLAIALSSVTDNHLIRIQPGQASFDHPLQAPANRPDQVRQPPVTFAEAPTIEGHFGAWLAARRAEGAGGPLPVIVIAAEGGGLRAAYWTALVLAELQAREPEFARHVFAISGVSGGSLGAATFASLVADCVERADVDCGPDFPDAIDAILGADFLAPTVATFLFRDLPQRFLPRAMINDRGVTLEQAWEAAWREHRGTDRFAAPFVDLWDDRSRFEVPLLFLNSTLVETGQRVIATPLPFDVGETLTGELREPPCGTAFDRVFSDAFPAACLLGYQVPLSTAVHNSARFTYVSPAGTIPRHPDADRPKAHLVDGGYFENSGAVTAFEILRAIEGAAAVDRQAILPIVLQISNDPLGTSFEQREEEAEQSEYWLLTQVRAPLKALLNVRPARGYQARESLRRYVLRAAPRDAVANRDLVADAGSIAPAAGPDNPPIGGIHAHFRLCQRDVNLPLGWVLSRSARDEMQDQLGMDTVAAEPGGIVAINRRNIEAVVQAIRWARDGGDIPPAPPSDEHPWSCPDDPASS